MGDDGGLMMGDDGGTPTGPGDGGGITTPPRGTDGGANQIACGGKACDSTTDVCCVTRMGEACTTAAACKGSSLACSGSNSCMTAGDVCCATVMGGTVTSKCDTMCAMGTTQLCTTNADCSGGDVCRRTVLGQACERPPTPRDGGMGGFDGGFRFDGGFPFDGGAPGH
jgi:hypothetical protein